jgi:hypothetical protein
MVIGAAAVEMYGKVFSPAQHDLFGLDWQKESLYKFKTMDDGRGMITNNKRGSHVLDYASHLHTKP